MKTEFTMREKGENESIANDYWQTASGKKLRYIEMTSEHLLNVIRQVVNAWARKRRITEIKIKQPIAVLKIKNEEQLNLLSIKAVKMMKIVQHRISEGEVLRASYQSIYEEIVELIELLAKDEVAENRRLP